MHQLKNLSPHFYPNFLNYLKYKFENQTVILLSVKFYYRRNLEKEIKLSERDNETLFV